jgi:hypothetical protein
MPNPLWKCSFLYCAPKVSLLYHWCNCRNLVGKAGTCSGCTRSYPNLNGHSNGGGAMPGPSLIFLRSSSIKSFYSRNWALALYSIWAWYLALPACCTDHFKVVHSKSDGGPHGLSMEPKPSSENALLQLCWPVIFIFLNATHVFSK